MQNSIEKVVYETYLYIILERLKPRTEADRIFLSLWSLGCLWGPGYIQVNNCLLEVTSQAFPQTVHHQAEKEETAFLPYAGTCDFM